MPYTTVTVTPGTASVTADGTFQFTATAHSDGVGIPAGDHNVTRDPAVTWQVDDESSAMINSGFPHGGLLFGRAAGTVHVSAQLVQAGLDPLDSNTATVTVGAPAAAPAEPVGRFLVAFDAATTDPYPAWTRLDTDANLVASYSIDRGRAYELDRTDTGRAAVAITDTDGLLDPTNPDGPYYGKLQPLKQAAIGRQDPVTGEWQLRFRGFVEDFTYQTDPSQKLNRLVVQLVDQFEILGGAELTPGQFGVPPPADSADQVYFPAEYVEDRISRIVSNFGFPLAFRVVLAGSVTVHDTIYSPGETAVTAIQEAVDAEFPGVSNLYCDRRGRLCFHSRQARFDPAGVAAAVGPDAWPYTAWKAGDGQAVAASPSDTAQVRAFGFNRGLSRIINSAAAAPVSDEDDETAGQLVADAVSIGQYGTRSWSAGTLLTAGNHVEATDAVTETRRFAGYYAANYAQPKNRVQDVTFRPLHPDDPRAAATWQLLNGVDIADTIRLTVALPGGGGFESVDYFVEGVHEDVQPLTGDFDDVTVRLDLSPRTYYSHDPWAPIGGGTGAPLPEEFEEEYGLNHRKVGRIPGRRRPVLHRRDHEHGGADPTRIHWESVGEGGPGGDEVGIQFDVDNVGGWLHIETTGNDGAGNGIKIESAQGILVESASALEIDLGSGFVVTADDFAFISTESGSDFGVSVTGGIALSGGMSSIGIGTAGVGPGGVGIIANAGYILISSVSGIEIDAPAIGFFGVGTTTQPPHPTNLAGVIDALFALGLVA